MFMLSLLLMIMVQGTQPVQGQFGPAAYMESYSPNLIQANRSTEVRVRIRTTIGSYPYRLRVTNVPSNWSVNPTLSNFTGNLPNNRNHDFSLNVTPPDANTVGEIGIQLEALNDFGDLVVVFQETITITSRLPPGTFIIAQPVLNGEVDGQFVITWNPSSYANEYSVFVRRRVGGQPQEPPVFEQETIAPLTTLSLDANEVGMIKGQQYQVDIMARNEIAQTWNSNQPHTFTVRPADSVGSFSITSPAANAELGTRPGFQWTAASAVVNYDLSILREVNGLPQMEDPVLIREGLTGTSLSWEGDPLDPGVYYVSMRAFGEDAGDFRFNEGGPVRFEVVLLTGAFGLIAPTNGQNNVPTIGIQDQITEFLWEPLPGAEGYNFRLYEELPGGGRELWTKTQIPHMSGLPFISHIVTGRNLLENRQYSYTVTAFAGNQELPSTPSRHVFQTTPMVSFNLVYPIASRSDVSRTPELKWNPTGGSNIVYYVQLAPMNNNGTPRLSEMMSSGPVTGTTHAFSQNLTQGQKYVWRVTAEKTDTDPRHRRINQGSWQRFQVAVPLNIFNLLIPGNGTTIPNTTPDAPMDAVNPTLSWQSVPNADEYRVQLVALSENGDTANNLSLPRIDLPAGTTSLRPLDHGIVLNSRTTYAWSVSAHAGQASRLAHNGPFLFTTGDRLEIFRCDMIDHFLGRQRFSGRDRLLAGVGGGGFDISYFILSRLAEPDQPFCHTDFSD